MSKILTTIALTFVLLSTNISFAQAPVDLTNLYTKNETVEDLVDRYSALYSVSSKEMMRVIMCESRGNTAAYNPRDVDNLPAFGVAQFKKTTFLNGAKKVGIENPDIWNPDQQIHVMAYYWSIGEARQWGCY